MASGQLPLCRDGAARVVQCRMSSSGSGRMRLPVPLWAELGLRACGEPILVDLGDGIGAVCTGWPLEHAEGGQIDPLVWASQAGRSQSQWPLPTNAIRVVPPTSRVQLARISVTVSLRHSKQSAGVCLKELLSQLLEGHYLHAGCLVQFPPPTGEQWAHNLATVRVEVTVPETCKGQTVGVFTSSTSIDVNPAHTHLQTDPSPSNVAGLAAEFKALADIVRCGNAHYGQLVELRYLISPTWCPLACWVPYRAQAAPHAPGGI